ncbi:hypothetical protein E5288_WYG009161 [Bos mutus]|uniref:Ribosomal protein L10e/L16 domain-containing protein n=1 Tax=Bos mutus TaxID=72004 RepID=A0A6B0QS73_9CETA|nr:hypothetical protein [Bos mutus]
MKDENDVLPVATPDAQQVTLFGPQQSTDVHNLNRHSSAQFNDEKQSFCSAHSHMDECNAAYTASEQASSSVQGEAPTVELHEGAMAVKDFESLGDERFQTAVSTGCLWKAPGHSGQVITPIHTELQNKDHVIEALHRAKFKFPGHQKISTSKEWELTKFNAEEFEDMAAETWLIPEDCGIKSIHNHGPLDTGPVPSSLRPHQ